MKSLLFLCFILFSTQAFAFCQWQGTAPWCGYSSNSLCPNGNEPYCYGDSKLGAQDRCGDVISGDFGSACIVGKKICCN